MLPNAYLALTLAVCATTAVAIKNPTANLKNGTYIGAHHRAYNQDFFLGVPYAQPPVGDLRFRVPHSLNSTWEEPRNATAYGAACYQFSQDGLRGSDDCLSINVVRPSGFDGAKLPVALWIHGGGLVGGSNSDPTQNLSFIVDESVKIGAPIIAASINYRLHAWGFMWGSAMKAEGAGNLGFRDQRLALHWVRENIGAFGGDPDKVVIWGQSGGARGVASQITAYKGRDDGLFRGAIMESATGFHTDFGEVSDPSSVTWDESYESLLEKVGCESGPDSLQCLREVPAPELASTLRNVTFPPWLNVIDGDFIQEHRAELIRTGNFVHIPIINGVTSDDGDYFAQQGLENDQQWKAWLRSGGADNGTIEALSALYPDIPRLGLPASLKGRPTGDFKSYGRQWKRAVALGGDRAMHGPRRAWVRSWAAANLTAYSYRFDVLRPDSDAAHGVGHSAELPFVFRNTEGVGYEDGNPFEGTPPSYKKLSKAMARMWVSFVNHLDPNVYGSKEIGKWPSYQLGEPKNLVFAINSSGLGYLEPDTYRSEQLEYLNSKLWKTTLEAGI
ncbi:hypothetical protein ACJ41O_012852 [Fusarium nematophilum]